MSLYTLIIVTFVIFMAINVIIGLRGRKHASTTKDFLTASGQSGIWFIIASAVGASIGSGVVIGTTQYAGKAGRRRCMVRDRMRPCMRCPRVCNDPLYLPQ